jgi:hypothetical protein
MKKVVNCNLAKVSSGFGINSPEWDEIPRLVVTPTYTDNYYINSPSPVTNHIWHRTTRFTISNNGNNLTLQPDEVVCY